jgi:hypothetical protein
MGNKNQNERINRKAWTQFIDSVPQAFEYI